MRLISWNVNKSAAARIRRQAAAIGERRPDLVALQEVRASTVGVWREELAAVGLAHVVCSLEWAAEAGVDRRRSGGGVLIASRWSLSPLPSLGIPWPERVLAGKVEHPAGGFELYVAYVPNAVTGGQVGIPWLKQETFEGIAQRLAEPAVLPRMLCGDFNAPLGETAEGEVVAFGRPGRAQAAELSVLRDLPASGLVDVFRSLHGYGVEAFSWYGRVNGYRLDHLFASPELRPRACRYLHEWRANGLSDHSAVEAEFGVATAD